MSDQSKYSVTLKQGRVWLGKRCDSGVWYLKYKLPMTGQYRERSTGSTSKTEAIREAEIISGQLLNQTLGVADGTIPLKQLMEKYFKAKEGRIKVKSFKRVKTSMATFMPWLDSAHLGIEQARHLTPEIVREYQQWRESSGISRRTVNNDIKNLHSIFKWGMKERLVGWSPADYSEKTGTIDLYHIPYTDTDVYTEQEYIALATEAQQKGHLLVHDLIIVFAGTGLRYEELAHVRKKDIHWDTQIPTIEIRAHDGWTPKDPDEIKHIPMLPDVQEVIRRRQELCRSDSSLVFTNEEGRPIGPTATRDKLQEMFAAVGIGPDRRLHWHSFRNYFVIRCLKKNVAINAIMRWTGHDSASMVLHYAKAMGQEDVYAEFRKVS